MANSSKYGCFDHDFYGGFRGDAYKGRSFPVATKSSAIVLSNTFNATAAVIRWPLVTNFSGGNGGGDFIRDYHYLSGVWTITGNSTQFLGGDITVDVYNQSSGPPQADGRIRRIIRTWLGSASVNIVGRPLYLKFILTNIATAGPDTIEVFMKTPSDTPVTFDFPGGTSIGLFTPGVVDTTYMYLLTPSYVSGTTYSFQFMIQDDIAKRIYTGGASYFYRAAMYTVGFPALVSLHA